MQGLRNNQVNQRQQNQFDMQNKLMDKRYNYQIGAQDHRDALLRNRNADKTGAYVDALNNIYGTGSPFTGLSEEQVQNLDPVAARSLGTLSLVKIPEEKRKTGKFIKDYTSSVPEKQRLPGQMKFNDIYADMVSGGMDPVDAMEKADQYTRPGSYQTSQPNYQPQQLGSRGQASSIDREDLTIDTDIVPVVDSPPVDTFVQEPPSGNYSLGVSAYDPSQAPILRDAKLEDIRQGNASQRAGDSEYLHNIAKQPNMPFTYRSGQQIPNSIELANEIENRAYLKETNDIDGLRALDTEIAESVNTLKQAGTAMRTIQDAILDKDLNTEPARKALDEMRSNFNAQFKQYNELVNAGETERARQWGEQIAGNLRRGLVNQFKFLPVDQQDAELVSAYQRMTGVIALQVAKELNGGRPSDPDKLGIVDAMGGTMNNVNTLFASQGGLFDFLASKVGNKVIATADEMKVNEFNDVYSTITGADYDPRGSIYEGITNQEIRSNQQDFSTVPQAPTQDYSQMSDDEFAKFMGGFK